VRAAALAALTGWCGACPAGAVQLCNAPDAYSVAEKDRVFRLAGVVKQVLEASGARLALVSRSGLDLSRFQVRYSHAGVTLKASVNAPWSVRQLYYACDQGLPRIFDQGMSGFVLGMDEPAVGYLSLVFLPPQAEALLERAALDPQQALQVLNSRYSANAYPYALTYQNCNQWLLELLAVAWAPLPLSPDARQAAQGWLRDRQYAPSVFDVGSRALMWLAQALPWLHEDDHPAEDLAQARYRVSMPASIEAFVRQQWPQATRVEVCHHEGRAVVHRGWDLVAAGCVPGAGDEVIALD
jgi:hypothetical protein